MQVEIFGVRFAAVFGTEGDFCTAKGLEFRFVYDVGVLSVRAQAGS